MMMMMMKMLLLLLLLRNFLLLSTMTQILQFDHHTLLVKQLNYFF